jgi:hypothetical protein
LENRYVDWTDDNIKTDLKEIGRKVVDLIRVVQDRNLKRALVNTQMDLWVALNSEDFLGRYVNTRNYF